MTPEQISDWEKTKKKGKFSYVLEQTMIFTPVILLVRLVVFYFFGESAISIGTALKELIISFAISLGIGAINWHQRQKLYKKSLALKSENNI